jgi:hypothetical protein
MNQRPAADARPKKLSSTSSDFFNPLPEVPAQKRPERHAIGVAHSLSDLLNALGGSLQQVHRAFHTQFLKIR